MSITDAVSKFSLNHPFLTTYIAVRVASEVCSTARKFLSLFQRAPTAVAVVPPAHEFTIEGDKEKGIKAAKVFLRQAWLGSDDAVTFSWKVTA